MDLSSQSSSERREDVNGGGGVDNSSENQSTESRTTRTRSRTRRNAASSEQHRRQQGGGAEGGSAAVPPSLPITLWEYCCGLVIPPFIHIYAIVTYVLPLLAHHPHHETVLDEIHILSHEQRDVQGQSSLYEVFTNDYWGRPMSKDDSHKSWRPVAVLSFRWLRQDWLGGKLESWYGMELMNEIFVARFVTVILHAMLAELVSIASIRLFPGDNKTSHSSIVATRAFTKLLFVLHPAHVEAVANAANRPHILAVIASMVALDDRTSLPVVCLALVGGLLSAETFVFQVPAIIVTMTVIRWRNEYSKERRSIRSLGQTIVSLIPRHFIIVTLSLVYVGGRLAFGTTDIPDGLMRRAENPFYDFTGMRRIKNYALVLSIHICKSLYIDIIGPSHEYGYDCVPELSEGWTDPRLILPFIVGVSAVVIAVYSLRRGLETTLSFLVFVSWMVTLFPVSGLIKVGTFIADRITVASTVASAMFGGRLFSYWIFDRRHREGGGGRTAGAAPIATGRGGILPSPPSLIILAKSFILFGVVTILWIRVTNRGYEWMTSPDLLLSSLRSCPRSAKSNLEISKVYSGLYPDQLDLYLAEKHIRLTEEIDPLYCDTHWQMAQLLFRQQKYLPMEDRLTKSVLCQFSMGGAAPFFEQYWAAVTGEPGVMGQQAKERYAKHQRVIQEAIQRAKKEEEESGRGGGGRRRHHQSSSPSDEF